MRKKVNEATDGMIPASLSLSSQNDDTVKSPDQNTQTPNVKVSFTEKDVDNMNDDEIINYTYLNIPDGLDQVTKDKLMKRADEIRRKQETQMNQVVNNTNAKNVLNNVEQFVNQSKELPKFNKLFSPSFNRILGKIKN